MSGAQEMTNVFKYDYGPTRTPPIGLPTLNLPGSFGDLMYQGGSLVEWGMNNWIDIALLGYATIGFLTTTPRVVKTVIAFVKKFIKV